MEGDQELLTEMIHLFQGDAPNLLAGMRDALQRGDMTVLERSAHSLKGAASNLSAKATAAAALQLEKDAKKQGRGSREEKSCGGRTGRGASAPGARRALPGSY